MVRMPSADDSYEVRKKAAWFSSWPFSLGEGIRLCIFAAGFEYERSYLLSGAQKRSEQRERRQNLLSHSSIVPVYKDIHNPCGQCE